MPFWHLLTSDWVVFNLNILLSKLYCTLGYPVTFNMNFILKYTSTCRYGGLCLRFFQRVWWSIWLRKIFQDALCPTHIFQWKLICTFNQHCYKISNSLRLQFNSSLFFWKLFETVLYWHNFFSTCATRWKHVEIHKHLCKCLLLICIKGKLVLPHDKTGIVSQETRPKFIDSQNFYFHFRYKLFCIKAVHLSNRLALMCPRLWPIEDISIVCMYLNVLWMCGTSWKKLCQCKHSFDEFSEKTKTGWIEVCWTFCR